MTASITTPMEERTVNDTKKPARASTFSDDEKAAMRERAKEQKAASRRGAKGSKADTEAEVLAKIAAMSGSDRAMAERIHQIVTAAAPSLTPKLWYGMPAYASDGKIVCFFQDAAKFKARYATLGFSDEARLDDGKMWPTSYALTALSKADEQRIAALVKQAVG